MTNEREGPPAAGDTLAGREEGDGTRRPEPSAELPAEGDEEGEYEPPRVLVLDEGPPPDVRRRRRVVLMVVAAVLLLAGFTQRDRLARWTEDGFTELRALVTSEPPSSPASEADGPGTAAATGDTASVAPDRPAAPGSDPRLVRLLDSLEVSIRRYRERHSDFRLGRLGCTGLIRGYVQVDQRFFAVSRTYGEAGPRTTPETAERYRRLATVTDSVNRIFDASGCERPE